MIAVIYKKRIIPLLIGLFLLTWAIASTALLFVQKKEVVILKLENGKLSEISGVPPSDIALVQRSFLMAFVGSFYTYDAITFENNMSLAKSFFSESGWQKVSADVGSIRNALTETNLAQAAVILLATPIKDTNDFELRVKFYNVVTTKTLPKEKKVYLHLIRKPKERFTKISPYPWEVESVEEYDM